MEAAEAARRANRKAELNVAVAEANPILERVTPALEDLAAAMAPLSPGERLSVIGGLFVANAISAGCTREQMIQIAAQHWDVVDEWYASSGAESS